MSMMMLLVLVLVSTATTHIHALTEAEEETLQNSLDYFETFIENSIKDAKTQLETTGTSCTINNYGCNPEISIPTINFVGTDSDIPAEYAYVQPKEWVDQDHTTDTDLQLKACQLSRMGPQWLQNYNDSKNQILYQYFTYPNNFIGFYPQSPFNCSETYTPTERPFYTSSAVGQKDVVILMDVSSTHGDNTWRLNMQKKIAEKT